jgi:gentisate 1,2-dioxygenase
VFSYPYARTREALDRLARRAPHPSHGFKLRFVNPASGGYAMPTIGAFMQLLPAGFTGAPYRQTDAEVFLVVEGQGRTTAGETVYDWGPRDIFVVPSWMAARHEARSEAVLFSLSDRPAQQALGFWREQAT